MYATREEITNAFCTLINDIDGDILRSSVERQRAIARIEHTKWELVKKCDAKEESIETEKPNSTDSKKQMIEDPKTQPKPFRPLGLGNQAS